MYSWQWSLPCILGLHRLCRARWDVMGGEATCSCDSGKRHSHLHTNTFAAETGRRLDRGRDAHLDSRGESRGVKPVTPPVEAATPHFDVQIKAVKPRRVVTVARFGTLEQARSCAAGMRVLGFQPIVAWKGESALVQ